MTQRKYIDSETEQVDSTINQMINTQHLDDCCLGGVAERGINRAGGSNELFTALRGITDKAFNGELKLSKSFVDRVQELFYLAGCGKFYESLNELNNIANGMISA